jgi:hypothetical protein
MTPAIPQLTGVERVYADLMGEVKERLNVIHQTMNGATGLSPPLLKEFCYLQLRMCCELIALACMVAHGDVPETQTNKLKGAWAADFIIKRLGQLREGFFPRPVRRQEVAPGHHHMAAFEGDFLSKEDLVSLVDKAGRNLHKGSVKALFTKQTPIQHSFPDISTWTNKIIMLLQEHAIVFDSGKVYYCILKAADHGGNVMLWIAKSPTDPIDRE